MNIFDIVFPPFVNRGQQMTEDVKAWTNELGVASKRFATSFARLADLNASLVRWNESFADFLGAAESQAFAVCVPPDSDTTEHNDTWDRQVSNRDAPSKGKRKSMIPQPCVNALGTGESCRGVPQSHAQSDAAPVSSATNDVVTPATEGPVSRRMSGIPSELG